MSTKKQKAEKAEKTEKPAKSENKSKNPPKWGTEAWIDAYPWTKMDKDRRRRVRNALGLKGNPATTQVIDIVDEGMLIVRDAFAARKLDIPVQEISKAKAASEALKGFFMRATNTVVAYDLSVKWGLNGVPVVKPCNGKCKKPCDCKIKKPCEKTCEKTCKKTCKKGKKA